MTVEARTIIENCQTALFDPDGVRWSAVELVRHLNTAQMKLIEARPDQSAVSREITLTPGFRFLLEDDVFALLDIPNNATGTFKRITKIDMAQMDMIVPGWRKRAGATEIIHFMHRLNEPRAYYLYPPAVTGSKVEMLASLYPTDVPAPSGPAATSVTGAISVPDKWEDALYNFVMFKAYLRDAEFGGNPTLAGAYKDLFIQATGAEMQTTAGNASDS
jgi:hypothetical protein